MKKNSGKTQILESTDVGNHDFEKKQYVEKKNMLVKTIWKTYFGKKTYFWKTYFGNTIFVKKKHILEIQFCENLVWGKNRFWTNDFGTTVFEK